MARRRINPGDKVRVRPSARERELLLKHTLADPEYAKRLLGCTPSAVAGSSDLVGEYTLYDLEDMLGYIAAEANHTCDESVQQELDLLYERVFRIQRSYDDGNWNDSAI